SSEAGLKHLFPCRAEVVGMQPEPPDLSEVRRGGECPRAAVGHFLAGQSEETQSGDGRRTGQQFGRLVPFLEYRPAQIQQLELREQRRGNQASQSFQATGVVGQVERGKGTEERGTSQRQSAFRLAIVVV